jgi:hypothetical protein
MVQPTFHIQINKLPCPQFWSLLLVLLLLLLLLTCRLSSSCIFLLCH